MKYVKLFESWLNEAEEEKKDLNDAVADDALSVDDITKMTIGDFKKLDSRNKGRVIEILQKSLFPGLDAKYIGVPKFDSKNEGDHVIFKGTDARPESVVAKLDDQKDQEAIINLKLKPSAESVLKGKIDSYTIGEMAEIFNKMVKTSKNPYTADEFFDKNTTNTSGTKEVKTVWALLDAEGGKKMSSGFKNTAIAEIGDYLKKDTQGQKFFAQLKNTIDANFAPVTKFKPAPKQTP